MMHCSLYILYSEGHDKYYVGQSEDVATRLLFHNELSENSFTSRYRPWRLMVDISFPYRSATMRAERYVKSRKSRAYLKELIQSMEAQEALRQRFKGSADVI